MDKLLKSNIRHRETFTEKQADFFVSSIAHLKFQNHLRKLIAFLTMFIFHFRNDSFYIFRTVISVNIAKSNLKLISWFN